MSTSKLTLSPGLRGPERRVRAGVRDDVDAEAPAIDLVDGQRHAIQGDRALGCDESGQRGRNLEHIAPAIAFRRDGNDIGDAVHMAGNDVAAQLVAHAQGALQIDLGALAPGAERRLGQRLARRGDREAAGRLVDHGQAAAAAGDRGADIHGIHVEGGRDGEQGIAAPIHGNNASHICDNSGEHGPKPSRFDSVRPRNA